MERRFRFDFSAVRIHSDSAADESTRALNALAYTVGHHIVFGAGRFALKTHEGRRLIAHELTHVVQQSAAGTNQKLIQETMFNRFDPNLLKSMLFQESEMGTAGVHLEDPPTHPVKSRFNLGQVIDSSGLALLTMLEREQLALVATFSLSTLRSELKAAQTESHARKEKDAHSDGNDATGRTENPIGTELGELHLAVPSCRSAARLLRCNRGLLRLVDTREELGLRVLDPHGRALAVREKDGNQDVGRNNQGLQRFRHTGEHYRDAVTKRVAGAKAAATAGTPFKPGR